jgi:hypothetical protein
MHLAAMPRQKLADPTVGRVARCQPLLLSLCGWRCRIWPDAQHFRQHMAVADPVGHAPMSFADHLPFTRNGGVPDRPSTGGTQYAHFVDDRLMDQAFARAAEKVA